MKDLERHIGNPFSTGGGGVNFETRVQALFAVLMLVGGSVPCFPGCLIKRIKLQGSHAGFDTDDLIVYVETPGSRDERKLLGQIRHSISMTARNTAFGEVVQAAWDDFNNPGVFARGKDAIGLITGPLSETDTTDVRGILEWARYFEDSGEFFRNVELANFSSAAKRGKLGVFRSHLKKLNGGQGVPEEEVYQFLKHFHLLGYDLDIRTGVTLSFLHALIGQYSQGDVQRIWSRLVDEVQSANQSAGTITIDSLPDDIRAAFQRPYRKTIPSELAVLPSQEVDWNRSQYASELAVTNLLGSWDGNSEADRVIASRLAKEDFDEWIPKIREILQQPSSPVSLKNGIWSITERKKSWQAVGQGLFDSHLDILKQCVVAVLSERDPRFELPPEERYAASIHGKILKHSQYLRKGLAESLALLGNLPSVLSNCSSDKPQTIASLSIRDIFNNSDWALWGSLNDLLPLFAEASPNQLLSAVETALEQDPCPFDSLFAQEGKGIFGENYLTGLLWALETLAWDEQYLVRVSVILGELASHDPGGRWANRPSNSLTTVFLPWFPQTLAPIQKRKVAIQTLQRENQKAAWELLLSLLPKPLQSSSGSSKPRWRMTIPDDWPKVTQKEYWDQVTLYAEMTVEIAEHDVTKLEELIGHLGDLPPQSLEKALENLSAEDIVGKPESERMALWTGLTELVSKHERFADVEWALRPDLVSRMKETASMLAPQNRLNLYRRLFIDRDIDLFEERGNWAEQQKKLEERRQLAIEEILDSEGSEAVLCLADMAESPWKVGFSLGSIADLEVDSVLLPDLLGAENKNLVQLTCGFVCGRHAGRGWTWVDATNMTGWSHSQIGQFLSYLPFTVDTWKRSREMLREFEAAYWSKVSVNPYQPQGELYVAIDKLSEYGRPNAAIQCLYRILHDKEPLDKTRTIRALLSALSSTEPAHSMDVYYIVEIIKALQDDPNADPGELARVEWGYLPLLERDARSSPKTLENRLASDPGFFCEVVRHVYRSKKPARSEKKHTEQEKAVAQNAYQLLRRWRTPPGMQPDGSFSGEHLMRWLESTKTMCIESGHLEVALIHVGQVLFYCPPDPDGLWINRAVAEALNARDADKMRHGFSLAIFNSRGMHFVDPSGKPELELSAKYRKQAEEVENAEYHRLAVTMRDLAGFYTTEANRIVEAHGSEEASDS